MADLSDFFENHRRKIERRAQDAQEHQAQADAITAEIREQQARINAGPPEADACPDCWVERGDTNIIVARRAADPSRFDRWGCPKCGFHFDEPTGLHSL